MNYKDLEIFLDKAYNFYEIDSKVLVALQTTQPLDEYNVFRVRSYVMLSFAAMQETLENLSIKILEKSINIYKKKQVLNSVVINLIEKSIVSSKVFENNDNQLIKNNWKKIISSVLQKQKLEFSTNKQDKRVLSHKSFKNEKENLHIHFLTILENEFANHINLVKNNNGFSSKIIEDKLFYFSDEVIKLLIKENPTALNNLTELRGDFAHKGVVQIKREKDYKNIIDNIQQCAKFIEEVEKIYILIR